jgi:hypothetical protein
MATKASYERAIMQELKDFPIEKLPMLLRLIRLLKEEGLSASKSPANALQDVDDFAVKTGIPDLALHHDRHLYNLDQHG